jgi:cell fate regulator YaaT (PSP1 superfamily)
LTAATVEVRFKGHRREYVQTAEDLRPGDAVIVAVERGEDLGRISAIGEIAAKKCERCGACGVTPRSDPLHVVRKATPDDLRIEAELRAAEDDVRRQVRDRVRQHGLEMKVSDAEWQWDRRKLTVYFTAEQRVDFRALVRDLAAVFKTRIELRQIGPRDEAKRLGGIGRCGRELCISTWLPEGKPVSLSLAKAQGLSLNPTQISGPCGRLLCCLHYEHEFYVQQRKRFPKEGKIVRTIVGSERVLSIDIFRERVSLRTDEGSTRIVPLQQFTAELR